MKKTLLLVTLFPALTFAEPSSEIPLKRNFPLSEKVNACENFHQYVCSIAESEFKLRDDRSHHTFAFNDSRERILEAKKKFMLNLPNEKNLNPRAQQVKDYYLGCMDTKSRIPEERNKVEEIKKEVNKISKAKDFVKYLNNQFLDGKSSLFSFFDMNNKKNPLKLDAGIYSSLMDLPDHSYYEKPEVMTAYKDLFVKYFKTIYPNLSASEAERKASQQIQLQLDFAKVYPVAAVRRQRFSDDRATEQKVAVEKYPLLQLNTFLKKLPNSTQVSIPIPESLQFLQDNLTDANLEKFKDFYLYKATSDIMDLAYPDFFQAQFDFEKNFFGGPQVRPDMQERCTTATSARFGMELDQILIDRLFPKFKDEKVLELASQIRQSIIKGIEKNTWLSDSARKEAIRKTQTARLQLVRPKTDKEWNFVPVQKYSKKMYLGNNEIRSRARLQKNIDDFRHAANLDAWGMSPLTVNAYYSSSENKFVMPIGILQFPFYDQEGSLLENLGAVGAVMGHELGHGIDDQGSRYDADGKLKTWMSMDDLAEFNRRGQKMIDQFNKAGHNGSLTQGENIADLVGLSFAYNAAFPENKGSVEDKRKFFIAYARLWCTVDRPDFAEMMLKTDPHAAGWARINEQVKHQTGFAEAFSCKSNDKMVLSDKDLIKIW